MDNRVVIRYLRNVKAGPDQPAHFAGERFTVTDAATAKALHPDAQIEKYADGKPFVADADASLIAAADAAKPKVDKPAKPAKPDVKGAE